MKVILIMLLALVGSVAMIVLCGFARWSFIYLIRYRLLKMEIKHNKYTVSRRNDVLSVIIVLVTLAVVVLLVIYGIPFVTEHISELPVPDITLS